MERLFEILKYRRNYETRSEREFLSKFIATIPGVQFDGELNYWVRIGETETMFSCHTDTVHWEDGKQKFLHFEDLDILAKTTVKKDPDYDGECLGADDGAGIWIMLNMIDAGVPGLYVFHRGEECGGIGSTYISDYNPWLVDGIKRAIAFDRKGTREIITHQAGGRCCSDEFAWALSGAFSSVHDELDLQPSPKGLFTDTANYTHLIPECTNLSVGYELEHTVNEALDLNHLKNLLAGCLAIDWESLPTVREPVDELELWRSSQQTSGNNIQSYLDNTRGKGGKDFPTYNNELKDDLPWRDVGAEALQYQDALEICNTSPEVVAELLLELGVTYDDVENTHNDLYGTNGNYRYN